MLRIGIVSTTPPRPAYMPLYVQVLNVERRLGRQHEGSSVVAIAGDTEWNQKFASETGLRHLGSAHDLIEHVDVAIVDDIQGSTHLENSLPLLEAGKHVFISKPFAASVNDAQEIVNAARRGGSVLVSCSPIRYFSEVVQLRAAANCLETRLIGGVGPADPESAYDGLHFSGVHLVEAAFEILGDDLQMNDVNVERVDDAITVTCRVESNKRHVQMVLTFIREDSEEELTVPFQLTVAGTDGLELRQIAAPANYGVYVKRVLNYFLDAAATGIQPMSYENLILPVSLLETIVSQSRQDTAF